MYTTLSHGGFPPPCESVVVGVVVECTVCSIVGQDNILLSGLPLSGKLLQGPRIYLGNCGKRNGSFSGPSSQQP